MKRKYTCSHTIFFKFHEKIKSDVTHVVHRLNISIPNAIFEIVVKALA